MKLSNHKKPTSAKWVKLGAAFTAVSVTIAGYALTASNPIVGYIGLALAIIGTVITIYSN